VTAGARGPDGNPTVQIAGNAVNLALL
jgi:hypothetical protein